jgi:hypothetical protein
MSGACDRNRPQVTALDNSISSSIHDKEQQMILIKIKARNTTKSQKACHKLGCEAGS